MLFSKERPARYGIRAHSMDSGRVLGLNIHIQTEQKDVFSRVYVVLDIRSNTAMLQKI